MELFRKNVFTEKGGCNKINTISLSELKEYVDTCVENARLNGKSPDNVPFFIRVNEKSYQIRNKGYGFFEKCMEAFIEIDDNDEMLIAIKKEDNDE